MKPIEFPEQTIVWAKNQPEYQPLPAYTDDRQTITCWKLSIRERFKIFLTGRMWFQQMNFGDKLQPQYMTVDKPFARQIDESN